VDKSTVTKLFASSFWFPAGDLPLEGHRSDEVATAVAGGPLCVDAVDMDEDHLLAATDAPLDVLLDDLLFDDVLALLLAVPPFDDHRSVDAEALLPLEALRDDHLYAIAPLSRDDALPLAHEVRFADHALLFEAALPNKCQQMSWQPGITARTNLVKTGFMQ
jgi:hypothetical protein